MINGKSVLGIIPARGGSKGVPRKNIREVAGKPLICWSIEAAQASEYIDRVIISSEDAEINRVASEYGCEVPFVRPSELSEDLTPGIDPVLHAITTLNDRYHYIVLLQPTSPLRSAKDIDGALELCFLKKAVSCVSVVITEKSPYWNYLISKDGALIPLIESGIKYNRRQDVPPTYALNGAIYIAETKWVLSQKTLLSEESIAYVMPPERSLDIDTEQDLNFFAFMKSME